MEKVLGIGGMFFRAKEPDALTRWYTENLGIDILEAVWQQDAGPTVFAHSSTIPNTSVDLTNSG